MVRALAAWFVLVGACASGDEIEVRLIHSQSLVPADFGDVEIRFVHEDGRLEQSGVVPRMTLSRTREVFEASELVVGRTYVAQLRAAASVCRVGHVVGRSMPFEHRGRPYEVPMQIGCADEFLRAPGTPSVPRLAHEMVTSSDGSAVLFGGAASVNVMDDPTVEEEVDLVERYLPSTGSFERGDTLVTERSLPAALPIANDVVAAIGGIHADRLPPCEASIELIAGQSVTAGATLRKARCQPGAAFLPVADRVLVAGGIVNPADAINRANDFEVLDGAARTSLDLATGFALRINPAVVALADGTSALVVGGTNRDNSIAAELVRVDGSCGEAACSTPVEFDKFQGNDVVRRGFLMDTTANYVPCATGGGAVFVVGGATRGDVRRRTLPDVFCYQDGGPPVFRRVGELPGKRRLHVTVLVTSPAGTSRLLVIGGTQADESIVEVNPYMDAVILSVDACSCSVTGRVDSIPVPVDGFMLSHAATRLLDESVLVVGGVSLPTGSIRADATGEAALFVPEIDP